MENEAFVLDSIRHFVWSGFYDDVDEIVERVVEVDEAGCDPAWLRDRVEEEFDRKRAEEPTWPDVTDCDRLDRVFGSLAWQGVIALQNAGNTQSDGWDDVSGVYEEAGAERSDLHGYCFYHGQDLERVMADGDLYLAFGDILGDETKGVEVGRRIRRALEAHGFHVEWNESVKTRLLVKGVRWQRRSLC